MMGFVYIKDFTKSLDILDTTLDLVALLLPLERVKFSATNCSAFGLYATSWLDTLPPYNIMTLGIVDCAIAFGTIILHIN